MKPWKANGIVVRLADASEEVTVEMRGSKVRCGASPLSLQPMCMHVKSV